MMASLEFSMSSVVGLTNNDIMKVIGKCGSEKVIVLIDSEASYNFVLPELVERVGLLL